MKKRLFKKWVNRFITPHLKGLKETNARYNALIDGYTVTVIATNHTIVNGYIHEEGCRYRKSPNKLSAFKRTEEEIKKILTNKKHVLVRIKPDYNDFRYDVIVYMRLITE